MRRRMIKLFSFLAVMIVAAIAVLILFRILYHDSIRTLADTQVRNATSDLINDAIDKQIEMGTIQYDRIVYF